MVPLQEAIIEVRIRKLGQLFNSLDPSPFTERDLDEDAEACIVGWAREVDTGGAFRLIVHLPAAEGQKARDRDLETAIRNYFEYRAGMLGRDQRDLFRVGRRSLAIGAAVLTFSIGISQVLRTSPLARRSPSLWPSFGWVANWRPAEIFLYDICSVRRRVRLYRRLASANIDLVAY